MEIELPRDARVREAIFARLTREWESYGEGFGADPDGRSEPREITRGEALAMGRPEAEGELVQDVGPPLDAGQAVMALWWD
jgi:hypothetical protein